MKAKVDEGGGRVLLGDNTGGMMVKQLSVRFQCVGVWISNGLPCINKYIEPYKKFTLEQTTKAQMGSRRIAILFL
jgi:hypothetical protein